MTWQLCHHVTPWKHLSVIVLHHIILKLCVYYTPKPVSVSMQKVKPLYHSLPNPKVNGANELQQWMKLLLMSVMHLFELVAGLGLSW